MQFSADWTLNLFKGAPPRGADAAVRPALQGYRPPREVAEAFAFL